MKKTYLITIGFLFVSLACSAQLKFGAGASLAAFDEFGVQGKILYNLENKTDVPIDAAGTFTVYFTNPGSAWTIDLDSHYRLLTISDKVEFDPLAGIQILRVSAFGFGDTDIGLNLGGHFTINSDKYIIYAQPKITIGGVDGFVLAGGIMF